jgi:Icc-related predicted phosphoesterase
MIIDCISDLHGHLPLLSGGDLLIIAGDLTANNRAWQYLNFIEWLKNQKYRCKVLVCGNRDDLIYRRRWTFCKENEPFPSTHAKYLCDSGIEFEGLKIWGSPWTKIFPGINLKATAFTVQMECELEEKWENIPAGIDILVTHGPAYGIFDVIKPNKHVGSIELRHQIRGRIKPRLHVFGHIHECGGKVIDLMDLVCVNSSYVDENYQPAHNAVRIIYDNDIFKTEKSAKK